MNALAGQNSLRPSHPLRLGGETCIRGGINVLVGALLLSLCATPLHVRAQFQLKLDQRIEKNGGLFLQDSAKISFILEGDSGDSVWIRLTKVIQGENELVQDSTFIRRFVHKNRNSRNPIQKRFCASTKGTECRFYLPEDIEGGFYKLYGTLENPAKVTSFKPKSKEFIILASRPFSRHTSDFKAAMNKLPFLPITDTQLDSIDKHVQASTVLIDATLKSGQIKSATGFVFNAYGHVATAAHVLGENSLDYTEVHVSFSPQAIGKNGIRSIPYPYRLLNAAFPKDHTDQGQKHSWSWDHKLAILVPESIKESPFDGRFPFWLDIACADTNEQQKGLMRFRPNKRTSENQVLLYLNPRRPLKDAPFDIGEATSKKAWDAEIILENCLFSKSYEKQQLLYTMAGSNTDARWSGTPVVDLSGKVWAVHMAHSIITPGLFVAHWANDIITQFQEWQNNGELKVLFESNSPAKSGSSIARPNNTRTRSPKELSEQRISPSN